MLKVVEKKWVFFCLSLAVIVLGVVFFFVRGGINLSVDYTGGTSLYLEMGQKYDTAELSKLITDTAGVKPTIVKGGQNGTEANITVKELNEEKSNAVLKAIRTKYDPSYNSKDSKVTSKFKVLSRDNVSATVGNELKASAFKSCLIALLLMLVYITIRFEFWSGVSAIITLLHDVLVVLSVYTIFNISMDSTFIAAILTIVGYSINDTIVIFDRIRENNRYAKKTPFAEVVDKSVKQTITRSLFTSLTTILSILVLYIMGVDSIKAFALPIVVGILVGTYSSICIASPVWASLKGDKKKK